MPEQRRLGRRREARRRRPPAPARSDARGCRRGSRAGRARSPPPRPARRARPPVLNSSDQDRAVGQHDRVDALLQPQQVVFQRDGPGVRRRRPRRPPAAPRSARQAACCSGVPGMPARGLRGGQPPGGHRRVRGQQLRATCSDNHALICPPPPRPGRQPPRCPSSARSPPHAPAVNASPSTATATSAAVPAGRR